MKKLGFGIFLMFLFSNFTCEEDLDLCNNAYPCCMQETIDNYLLNYQPAQASKANIIRYSDQDGNAIFSFDPGSDFADWMYEYVDVDCQTICNRGGIGGIDTCQDYVLSFVDTVWIDPR